MRNILPFFLLAACATGTPAENPGTTPNGEVAIEIGECEGSAFRVAGDDSADTGIPEMSAWAEVSDDKRLVVHLDDTSANCCPSPEATFDVIGRDVALEFLTVTSSTSCDCACIIDFVATSEPFPAGEYTLTVSFDGGELEPLVVEVP